MNKPTYIIIHHTGGTLHDPRADTSHHTFEGVNEYHRQKWNFRSSLGKYIGYHYFIDRTGKVTQGRGEFDEGAHTIGMNNSSIGICLAGNFDVYKPTEKQKASLKRLLDRLVKRYNIPSRKIVPHRIFSPKSCYGSRLSNSWGVSLLREMYSKRLSLLTVLLNTQMALLALLKKNKHKLGVVERECSGLVE